MQPRVLLCTAVLLGFWSLSHAAAERAHLTVKGVRLTDNGDNDGFADPHETVNVYVTLRNGSGSDRNGLVVRMGSTDSTVACIPTPVVSFGSLQAGDAREAAVPLVFRVANVVRTDPSQDLVVTLDFVVSGDDFGTTKHTQSVTLDVDLNVSGGFLPTSYTEGFESAGFGSFTTQTLDAGRESLAGSDGHRCQYNDPDFANSNSHGSTYCFLGAPTPLQNAYDWHVHTTASPDGGRAYLGNNSLHWGVHAGATDTTRLRQLDAIRTTNTINLGWNGVASELSFKHQVGLTDCDYISCWHGHNADRGVVQVQLASSTGQLVGHWRKINPYENLYDTQTVDHYANCLFDPVDDGNTEDDYFEPTDPERRLGPSSTCFPEFSFSRQGATSNEMLPWLGYLWPLGRATDGPALVGIRGPGRWVESKFSLDRWRGRRIRLRFLTTSIEVADTVTMQQALGWDPTPADDGWYIDDIQVSNTLTSTATVSVDTADRSGLPACGPVCTSLAASLVAAPARGDCAQAFTLDAFGSSADQCPGGALQFRFWWTWPFGGLPPVGVLNEKYGVLLQDWNENGIFSHPAETIGPHPYRVDVRCSTLPACGASATGEVTVDPSCPRIIDFPYTIRFDSPSILSWGTPTYFEAYRGNLDAVRASGGNFAGTQEASGYGEAESSWSVGQSVPGPGESKYYLVRGTRTTFQPPHACTLYTWSTGSPAEVPGAGGSRDQDLEEPGTVPCP